MNHHDIQPDQNEENYEEYDLDYDPSNFLEEPASEPVPTTDRPTLNRRRLVQVNSPTLPYLLHPITNHKIFIDTGSTNSFIQPIIANHFYTDSIKKKSILIRTRHGTSQGKFCVKSPFFEIFRTNVPLTFHDNFDYILRIDNLRKLRAKIEISEITLDQIDDVEWFSHKTNNIVIVLLIIMISIGIIIIILTKNKIHKLYKICREPATQRN